MLVCVRVVLEYRERSESLKDKTIYNGSVGREGVVLSSNFGGGASGGESNFELARSENQELTFEQLESFGVRPDNDFFERYGMTRGGRIYTNIAYLLSDQCDYTVKLNVFGGKSKIDFVDRTEFRGSVLKQCGDVCAYIGKRFSGSYPAVALYEAVSNSLIHRNYDYRGSVLINIYSDKLEISSIGGLVGDITVDDILVGISQPRNRLLAEFFYRYGTTTVCGAGIDRIVDSYHNKAKKPEFRVTDNVFLMMLPNLSYADISTTDHERRVLEYLATNPFITRKTTEELLNVSQTMAGRVLKGLVIRGVLKQTGGSVNSKYFTDF